MSITAEFRETLATKFEVIFPHLDERQRRLLMGAEARLLGHGGIRAVARAAGVREATVSAGVDELDAGVEPLGRARRPGGGRKRAAQRDPGLVPALLGLVEPDERGDPMSPLRWTTKSTRALAAELTRRGHPVSADTVAGLLREQGFSLQANAKTIEGRQHPDRDGQFRYINEQVKDHQHSADPVISVDAKKKELVGRYHNAGRQWRPAGQPVATRTHDFPDELLGKAVPYGIYDLTANTGWVNVGTDHDTAAFAVESIRRWWNTTGHSDYPQARRLLITADAGGSNSYRTRAWKTELAALAVQTGLDITVCHFPPGTSKWNKVEHRLFSHITLNWRGRPLTSHEVIVQSIAATTTSTGLRVQAALDTGTYPKGVHVTDEHMAALPINRHDWHGDWNYTLRPQPTSPTPDTPPPQHPSLPDLSRLIHPAITAMPTPAWDDLITQLTVPHQAHHEAFLHNQRGHARRRGGGRHIRITLSHQLLATLLHHRYRLPRQAIADLFGVSLSTIAVAVRHTRALLAQTRRTIQPADTPLRTLAEFAEHAHTAGLDITNEIEAAYQFPTRIYAGGLCSDPPIADTAS